MDRRHFLRPASIATIGGFSSPLLRALGSRDLGDRVLVVVQLYGGNDGLNTVIPLDQYGILSSVRPHVLIPENQVLPLSGLSGTGLHPALDGLQDLWNDGKLSIVQGVSYPEPNYSHFRTLPEPGVSQLPGGLPQRRHARPAGHPHRRPCGAKPAAPRHQHGYRDR